MSWQPSAEISALRDRAKIIAAIRKFFAEREVLEVETPSLSHTTVTDPYIATITAEHRQTKMYLQTSPEYAMKRLLAAGSGCIYQITKAFRSGDIGQLHNPEFTILEWYRLDFDHHALMDEVDELLQLILKTAPAHRVTTKALYQSYLNIDPHLISLAELQAFTKSNVKYDGELTHRNTCLELLFTHCIEPYFSNDVPVFIYDFPESQAALAKIRKANPPIASRFEVYFKGIELANGFHELQDEKEQRKRFENDLKHRRNQGLPEIHIDEKFLSALTYGLPNCAGVALGVDRLIMLALGKKEISEVVSFAHVSM